MHSKVNKLVRSLTGAVLVASVAVASFTGCTTGQTEYTEGMRDGNDINTFETTETTEETEPEATPTPTNTPTPTPSPTPAIPHMDMPDVDTTAPFFLTLPESVSIENGSEFDINRHLEGISMTATAMLTFRSTEKLIRLKTAVMRFRLLLPMMQAIRRQAA